jgi:hypothetical protein
MRFISESREMSAKKTQARTQSCTVKHKLWLLSSLIQKRPTLLIPINQKPRSHDGTSLANQEAALSSATTS